MGRKQVLNSTNKVLRNKLRWHLQEEKCALCDKGLFMTPLVSTFGSSPETLQKLARNCRGLVFRVCCHDLDHHELVHHPSHSEDDDEAGFAFGSCRLKLHPPAVCCSRSCRIFAVKLHFWMLFHWESLSTRLFDLVSSCEKLLAPPTWLVVVWDVSSPSCFTHHDVPLLYFDLALSLS